MELVRQRHGRRDRYRFGDRGEASVSVGSVEVSLNTDLRTNSHMRIHGLRERTTRSRCTAIAPRVGANQKSKCDLSLFLRSLWL